MVLRSGLGLERAVDGEGRWARKAQSPKHVVRRLRARFRFSPDGDTVAGREPCGVASEAQGARSCCLRTTLPARVLWDRASDVGLGRAEPQSHGP